MLRTLVVAGVVLFAGAPVVALTPAEKCESAKLKEAGKYGFCRLKAEAKAVKGGGLPDFTKCATKIGGKWPAIESKGGGSCPWNGDELLIRAVVDQHTDDLAVALGGGVVPDCGGELATCEAELASCLATPVGQLLRTGQAACYDASGSILACAGTGQDGEHETGLSAAYVDNGNGTLSDGRTGLMWEKLSDDGSIHDRDNLYSWTAAFTRIDQLNAPAFAGHTDWRLPNRSDLLSIIRLSATEPSVHPAFNAACMAGCSVTTCSCTLDRKSVV